MKRRILKLVVLIAFVALLSFVVMLLWNAVLPSVSQLGALSYLQAVGLFVLCRILFGGFSGIKNRGRMALSKDRMKMKEQLRGMSKEEKREYIRSYMQNEPK